MQKYMKTSNQYQDIEVKVDTEISHFIYKN